MTKKIRLYCCCGGILKNELARVEFFGTDFGMKKGTICTKCNTEFIDNDTLEEIRKKIFN